MERRRIANGKLNRYEDAIACLIRVQRELQAITVSLDIDTLTYNADRIAEIHKAAKTARSLIIDMMNEDKDGAGK